MRDECQIHRSRQSNWMFRPKHALLRSKHLALDPLSIGIFVLAHQGHSQTSRSRQRVLMLGSEYGHLHLKQLTLQRLCLHVLAFTI